MFKKKKGSTLVTVLAVAVVFMTIALAIITSIMGTMKTNTNQKVKEDLRYAAESGLEIARSYLEGKGTITQDDINEINTRLNNVLVDTNKDNLPDNEVGSVKMVSPTINGGNIENPPARDGDASGEINGFTVRIRAEKTGNSDIKEEIGSNYEQVKSGKGNGSIFDHSVVASEGEINIRTCRKQYCNENCPNKDTCCTHCYGHIDPDYSSGDLSSNKGTNINGVNKKPDDKIDINDYQEINFVENTRSVDVLNIRTDKPIDIIKDLNSLEIKDGNGLKIEIMNIKISKESLINDKLTRIEVNGENKTLEEFRVMEKSAVMLVEIDGVANRKLPILMTNAEKVNLELNGGASVIKYGVWLNKGVINISGTGALHLAYATMFGETINYLTEMVMNISYPTGDKGHGIITHLTELNKIIEAIIPNWNSGGSSSGESGKTEIKFKGEFSN